MINKIIPKRKNVWRYSLIHLALFVFMLIVLDFAAGTVLKHFFFKLKSGEQYNTTYAIEEAKVDLIVFGSSRAVHHYYPSIFEHGLKVSYFNAGRDGQKSTLFHYAVLKGILKRYTPKLVILDVMNGELGDSIYSYDKLSSLSPYYAKHPEMRPIIELRSDYEKLRMLSSIYPFNSLVMSIISGNINRDKKNNADEKGYAPLSSTLRISKPVSTITYQQEYALDSIKVRVFRSFIEDCIKAHIKLYIVCSPYYQRFIGTDYSILTIKKMAAAYNVEFFDFSQESTLLKSPELFGDIWHLNQNGAKIFSNMLVDQIKISEKLDTISYIK